MKRLVILNVILLMLNTLVLPPTYAETKQISTVSLSLNVDEIQNVDFYTSPRPLELMGNSGIATGAFQLSAYANYRHRLDVLFVRSSNSIITNGVAVFDSNQSSVGNQLPNSSIQPRTYYGTVTVNYPTYVVATNMVEIGRIIVTLSREY